MGRAPSRPSCSIRSAHEVVGARRKVEELLGEGLGEVAKDVLLAHDPDDPSARVDERDVAERTGLHQLQRGTDRLVEPEGTGRSVHERLDRRRKIDGTVLRVADEAGEDVPLGEDPDETAVRIRHDHRVPYAAAPDGLDTGTQRRARRDDDGVAPADDLEGLVHEPRWDEGRRGAAIEGAALHSLPSVARAGWEH